MKELLEELAELRREPSTCTDAKIIDIMVSLAAKIAAIEKRLDDEDMLRAERLERQ